MKKNNFTYTISFALTVLALSLLTITSFSWVQGQKGMEDKTSLGNLNASNATASATAVRPSIIKEAINIKNDTHSYINSSTATIKPGTSNHTVVVCNISDPLVGGGYSVGFKSQNSLANVFIYANHPTGFMTNPISDRTTGGATRFFVEGWDVGLSNNGNESITITAQVLCANVQ